MLGDPVVGIDEAGRGPLAGGVYAGAVLAIDADTFFGAFGRTPEKPAPEIKVNLLRRGAYVSSLAPEGESVPLNV